MITIYTCPECNMRHKIDEAGARWETDILGGWECEKCKTYSPVDEWKVTSGSESIKEKLEYVCRNIDCKNYKVEVKRGTEKNNLCFYCPQPLQLLVSTEKTSKEPENKEKLFYMIWNPLKGVPAVKHDELKDADEELIRLCKENPEQDFYLMRAISRHTGHVEVEYKVL